jgi:hypothetical protein
MYSRISSTKSQSFFITNFNASLTNLTVLLSHVTAASTIEGEYWLLHRSDCKITQTYAHKTSCTLPSGNISLGSVTLLAPEAGDIVELIVLSSRFNIKKFYVLTTECIYMFYTVLRTNSYYFPKHQ